MEEGIEVQLTTGQKKLGVGVCWITLVGWIGTMVLWGVGLIGDDASGFWWLLPALLGIPLAVLIQIAARMASEEESLPGAPFMTNIATIAVVVQMISQLNGGGLDTDGGWGQNIVIGIWAVGMLFFSWKNLLPIWARVTALVWGVVWFVDGFVHILGAAGGPLSKDFVTAYDSSVFIVGLLAMFATIFAIQAAFRKSVNSG